MKKFVILSCLLLAIASSVVPTGCNPQPPPSPTPPVEYSQYQLEYILFSAFDIFWCDQEYYPIGRPGIEEQNSLQQFSAIRSNPAEFSAILEHLSLPEQPDYTDAQKLLIYREHKMLTLSIEFTTSGTGYQFNLRRGEGQGERIQGTISATGTINVQKRETSFNTCPICLAKGTLIDTPDGQIPVEQLRPGIPVWSADESGKRFPATIIKTVMTPVPDSFQAVRLTLDDGRTVTASPSHPAADGRALGDFREGESLDGSRIVTAERVTYRNATYDILPAGATGQYWANGILLKSTLFAN